MLMNFIEEIWKSGVKYAGKRAIKLGDATLTYGELVQAARRRVNRHDTMHHIIADKFRIPEHLMAAWLSNATAVLIDPTLPQAEIDYRLDQSSARETINRSDALILFTSGTTGRAKGVIHTISSLDAQIKALRKAWHWDDKDRLLLPVPLTHVHGLVTGLLSVLSVGASIELMDRFDVETVWKRLKDATVFTAVPTVYYKLLKHYQKSMDLHGRATATDSLRGLRLMISGSAPLSGKLFDDWAEISGHLLLERYGSTEAGIVLSNPLHGQRLPGIVGQPLDGVAIKTTHESELLISGPTLFRGYLNDAKTTEEVLRDGWFHTGDQARMTRDGVQLLGRAMDIIKVGGYKVSALEVENAVMAEFGDQIYECAVVGTYDHIYGEAVTLVYVGDNVIDEYCMDQLTKSLTNHQMPRKFFNFPHLPRNIMGKVDKRQILRFINDRTAS